MLEIPRGAQEIWHALDTVWLGAESVGHDRPILTTNSKFGRVDVLKPRNR